MGGEAFWPWGGTWAVTRDDMMLALSKLGELLEASGTEADIVIARGVWMALVLGARGVTRDIDAYLAPPAEPVRRAAAQVAERLGLPEDWINDGINGFFFQSPPQTLWHQFGGLRVYAVTPDYMLVLKVYAAREADRGDTRALLAHLGVRSADDAMAIVERYIPPRYLTPKHRYFIEDCLGEG